MAKDFNAKSIFERFADNPFLQFYEDAERCIYFGNVFFSREIPTNS